MSRVSVGDFIIILPAHTLRFKGRWGQVTEVDPSKGLPIGVKFSSTSERIFWFCAEEFMTVPEYHKVLVNSEQVQNVNTHTRSKVLGGEFPYIEVDEGRRPVHFLIPVTECSICGKDTTGQIDEMCEECRFPLPQENEPPSC